MTPLRRRIAAAAILLGAAMTAGPASAAVEGACEATFSGIAIDRIDALGSPLELDTTDTLTFEGVSEEGTLTTSLRLLVGPVTVDSSSVTYTFSQHEFAASISLKETGLYGVGLFRVIGEVDDCVAEAWVRVSGRFPGTTLIGLVAVALTLGGMTGQLGAVVGRRRWPRARRHAGDPPNRLTRPDASQRTGRRPAYRVVHRPGPTRAVRAPPWLRSWRTSPCAFDRSIP